MVAVMVNVTFDPTAGVALFTLFVTARSVTGVGTGVTVEVLFEAFGSDSLALIDAVFAYEPVALTVATIWSVTVDPLVSVPIDQTPVPEVYVVVPPGVAETNV